MATAGYSGTPLARKLGIKAGYTVRFINQPEHYLELFSDLPEIDQVSDAPSESINFIHMFCREMQELERWYPEAKDQLVKDGLLWISWPKGSSKIPTDLNRDIIRNYVLNHGLVDVKVAAVDEDWSGLKFVYRTKDR